MLRVPGEQYRLQIKGIQLSPQQRYYHIDDLRWIELASLRNIPVSVPETAQGRLGACVELRHSEQILQLALDSHASARKSTRFSRQFAGNGAVEQGGLRGKGRPGF